MHKIRMQCGYCEVSLLHTMEFDGRWQISWKLVYRPCLPRYKPVVWLTFFYAITLENVLFSVPLGCLFFELATVCPLFFWGVGNYFLS